MIPKIVFPIAIFVAFGLLLFVSAGTFRWPAAWVLMAEMAVAGLALDLWLKRHDPSLLAERSSSYFQSSQASWDKALVIALAVASCTALVVMAFDAVRFGWSHVPVWLQLVGALLVALYAYLNYLIFRENTYAVPVVKVQSERGHQVVDTGPYAYVRHPMYTGLIFLYAGASLLLGSWYGLAAGLVCVVILGIRAVHEERTLETELAGYRDYAARVRYRLVPGIW